jgi:hypothetical protein
MINNNNNNNNNKLIILNLCVSIQGYGSQEYDSQPKPPITSHITNILQ